MSRVLPILFNTDLVRAILDGRKTVTRRVIKFPDGQTGRLPESGARDYIFYPSGIKYPPYQPGDILYVRETYKRNMDGYSGIDFGGYIYKADCPSGFKDLYNPWHPSIHMPKEAARIWLKVTDARVERLQDMRSEDALNEGIKVPEFDLPHTGVLNQFKRLWNSTLKKFDLARYGWDANPWVWVIEFERCRKPECKSCLCQKCDNDDCKWHMCQKNSMEMECYTNDCDHYFNEQEEIDEGLLDGYSE